MGNPVPPPPMELNEGLASSPEVTLFNKVYDKIKGGVPIGDFVEKQVAKAPDDPSHWVLNTIEDLGLVTAKTVQGLTTPTNLAIIGAMALGQEEAILPKLAQLGFSVQMLRGAVQDISKGAAAAKHGNYREAGRLFGSAGVNALLIALASGKKPQGATYKVSEGTIPDRLPGDVKLRETAKDIPLPTVQDADTSPFGRRDQLQSELAKTTDPARARTLRRQIEAANREVESASVASKASGVPPAPWGQQTELPKAPEIMKGIVPVPAEPVPAPPEVIVQPRTLRAEGQVVSVTPDDIRAYVGAKLGNPQFSQVVGPKGDQQNLADDSSSEAQRIREAKLTKAQHAELFPGQPYRAGMRVGQAVDDTPGIKHPETGHKFSSTQIDLPEKAAAKVLALAKSIPDSDLSGEGRETNPHVTVKYGLHEQEPGPVEDFLGKKGPITLTLGKTSFFNPSKSSEGNDVVIVGVDSPELRALNRDVSSNFKVTDTHPEYKPHITLAYVKPGLGAKYADNSTLEGEKILADEVTFFSRNGKQATIKLKGAPTATLHPAPDFKLEAEKVVAPKYPALDPGWKLSLGSYDPKLAEKYLKSYRRNSDDAKLVADPQDASKRWIAYKPKPPAVATPKSLGPARAAYEPPSGPKPAPWKSRPGFVERRLRELNTEMIGLMQDGKDVPPDLWSEREKIESEFHENERTRKPDLPQISRTNAKIRVPPSTDTPEARTQALSPVAPPGTPKESTPEEKYRSAVEEAGAEWNGLSKDGEQVDGVMFTDPKTKSTLYLPADQVSKASVERRLAESRAQHDQARRPTAAFESGPKVQFVPERNGILFAGPKKYPVEYGYIELSDAIPSHNAPGFAVDPRHPGQQRVSYEFNPAQKAKLQEHFMAPEPDQLLSDGVTGVEGPPVMTPDGKIAGGNGRTMLYQMLYASPKAKMIRDAVVASAEKGGAEGVERMKQPIRVRRIEAPETVRDWMKLTEDLNLNPAAETTAPERTMSVGRRLSASTMQAIAGGLEDIGVDATIRDLMSARPVDFVRWLTEDGALSTKDRIRYIDPETGGLNEEGRALYESAVLGATVKDVRLLERGSRSVIAKLGSSLGPLARLQGREDEWDITPLIVEAAKMVGDAQQRGLKIADYVAQQSLFGEAPPKAIQNLAEFLDRPVNQVKKGLNQFANEAGMGGSGQGLLGVTEIIPSASFNAAFVEPVEKGPPTTKGGKPKEETTVERERRERLNAEARRKAHEKMLTPEEYEDAIKSSFESAIHANEEK